MSINENNYIEENKIFNYKTSQNIYEKENVYLNGNNNINSINNNNNNNNNNSDNENDNDNEIINKNNINNNNNNNSNLKINEDDYFISNINLFKQRFPCCIVWTPIPCITWFVPNIGHMGICNSKGIIHDFSGSYYISQDDMAFGNPTKFIKLKIKNKDVKKFDECVEKSLLKYDKKLEYNFFCNNCHSFVADVLNEFQYENANDYGIFNLWWKINTKSEYVSCKTFLKTYCGFFILVLIVVAIVLLVVLLKK